MSLEVVWERAIEGADWIDVVEIAEGVLVCLAAAPLYNPYDDMAFAEPTYGTWLLDRSDGSILETHRDHWQLARPELGLRAPPFREPRVRTATLFGVDYAPDGAALTTGGEIAATFAAPITLVVAGPERLYVAYDRRLACVAPAAPG